jgi:hypothetical protein
MLIRRNVITSFKNEHGIIISVFSQLYQQFDSPKVAVPHSRPGGTVGFGRPGKSSCPGMSVVELLLALSNFCTVPGHNG